MLGVHGSLETQERGVPRNYIDVYGVMGVDGVSQCLRTMQGGNREPKIAELQEQTKKYRIRKLTPRECWRLQAFTDEQFDKAKAAGLSDSQLYKQAGNAVTVNVIKSITRKALPLMERRPKPRTTMRSRGMQQVKEGQIDLFELIQFRK